DRGAQLRRLAVRMPGLQGRDVRVTHRVVRGEALAYPRLDRIDVVAEHPLHEPERPEVLAAAGIALAEPERLHGVGRELRDVELDHLKAVELAALPRILRVARLREPAARERIRIQDDQRAALEQRQVDLQRRGIERDEHLRRVAGSRDRPHAEMDLVSGYAERRAGRRADLGRIIRERAEILARESRSADELRAHQLNAVAGITGKA